MASRIVGLPQTFSLAPEGSLARDAGTGTCALSRAQRFRCGQTRLSGSGSFTIPKWVLLRADEVIERWIVALFAAFALLAVTCRSI
jgi:hypothetical protein